jgi:hypothetical protein
MITNSHINKGDTTMKTPFASFWMILVLTGLLVTGCKNNGASPDEETPPNGVTTEIEAMKYFASNDQFVTNADETLGDRAVEPMDYGSFGKIQAEIIPVRYGRFIQSVTRTVTVTIQPGDSIAVANIVKTITGTLRILAKYDPQDTTLALIEKPFTDQSERNMIFKRVDRNPRRFWLNWVPVATSLVAGGTTPPPLASTLEITKLQLFLPNGDTITVTDPTNYFLRYHWMRVFDGGRRDLPDLEASQHVRMQVTLVSSAIDTDIVVLRYGAGPNHRRRVRLALLSEVDNGNNTYTRVFETRRMTPPVVHFHRGFFHMGIDAMTRETLFDDTAPYHVSFWGIPYRVR